MSKWLQSSPSSVVVSGTTGTVTHAVATAGNLLMAVVASSAALTMITAGWSLVKSAVGTSGLYVWSKTAAGGESSLQVTVSVANAPIQADVYELPTGSTFLGSASQTGVGRSGVAVTGLSGLASTAKLFMHIAAYGGASSALTDTGAAWGDDTITDLWAGQAGSGSIPSIRVLIGYLEDSIATSWGPTVYIGESSGFDSSTDRITLALQVPAALDAPVVTVTSVSNPTTVGGTDGTITVTWPAVDGADHYEAGIADGHGQTGGFTTKSANATSPYVFTGLDAGEYTVAIKAHPEA